MVDLLAALAGQPKNDVGSGVSGGLRSMLEFFAFNGSTYGVSPFGSSLQSDIQSVGAGFEAYVNEAYRSDGTVFAVELVRTLVFAEARPMYRRLVDGRPGELFSTPSLGVLRNPSPGVTGRKLRVRAINDADFAGNFFAVKEDGHVFRHRPDWMTVMLGTNYSDVEPWAAPDVRPVGYLYHPGGVHAGNDPIPFTPEMVAHWAPLPDPLSPFRGMSWLTPIIREITTDKQATEHKQKFFDNGATPNMVVSLPESVSDPTVFKQWVELFNENHQGAANAYKTLFLGGGADATVVGKDFQQLDFKSVQGAGEIRIANAGGIDPTVIGLSESLQGSALNAGNYQAARRSTADKTFRPLWADYHETMSQIVTVPRGAELWYDDRDIEFLQEDQKDNAEIQSTRAMSIRQLVDAGYESESVVDAIVNDDFKLLKHSGLFSVQLQEAGTSQEPIEDLTDD